MTPRKLALLGSTGSIGTSTLDVVSHHPGAFDVHSLAAYSNIDLLVEQCMRFHPQRICIVDESCRDSLVERLTNQPIEILAGEKGLLELARDMDVDVVVNAIVGAAGMLASLEVAKNGKSLALANKESLVAGGPLFGPLLEKHGGRILPIDSEHSAIWQALSAGRENEVKTLIITASGGPFRSMPIEHFGQITPEMALNHPTWKMGPKITIDSATMANKGLEVIEAVMLFKIATTQVKVLIHPQSIVHSMVEFVDSSIIAQLSEPDMRLPITYALFWPERAGSLFGQLDVSQLTRLDFEQPDFARFPALELAFAVAETGGTAPAVYNAANEIAVEAFLNRELKFVQIPELIRDVVDTIDVVSKPDLDGILEADRQARETARKMIGKLTPC